MRCGYLIIGLVAATLSSGCASFKKSVENRVAISEECRETLSTPPANLDKSQHIASVAIGYVGHCDLTHGESFLAMCSLAQIRTKFGITPVPDPATIHPLFQEAGGKIKDLKRRWPKPKTQDTDLEKATVAFYNAVDASMAIDAPDRRTIWGGVDKVKAALSDLNNKLHDAKAPADIREASQAASKALDDLAKSLVPILGDESIRSNLDAFDQAVSNLSDEMKSLAAGVSKVDGDYQALLKNVKLGDFAHRTAAMEAINYKARFLKDAVQNVRRAHQALRQAAMNLSMQLSQQAAIELAAWDSNLQIQLAQLEQLLSGDFSLVFNAGVRDEVLTHVARRSLELLHGALKPADAVINRLDDKAYGALSVSYLAFGPSLQDAVDKAYAQVTQVYTARLLKGTGNTSIDPFLGELKRAACDNLTQGTQFSMLSELVDTMLILKVPPGPDNVKSTPSESYVQDAAHNAAIVPKPSGPAQSLSLAKARFILQSAADVAAAPPPRSPGPDVTPLSVYAANQWMARQQLLTKKITDAVTAPRTDGSPKPTPFQTIETVDEGLVKQIADAATAKAIDDATRLNPAMLDQKPAEISPQIQNSVNVVTAATAVSQAAAVLKLNLSISNVNTFSPTNTNTVAPVINVSPAAGTPSAAASPCTAIDFESIGVSCFDHGGDMVLAFSSRHFRSDSCMPDDLAPALSAVGNMLKGYRARSGIGYHAAVDGYASLPTARLAHCPRTAIDPTRACSYVNALRQPVSIMGCEGKHTNRNLDLSARRARAAASALEDAAGGAVIVDRLQAFGTETAGKRETGAPAAIDQAVMIRLTPVVKL